MLKVNSEYLGIEVKYQAQVSEREVKPIAPIKNYLTLSKEDVGMGENILVVPIEVFLQLDQVLSGNDPNLLVFRRN